MSGFHATVSFLILLLASGSLSVQAAETAQYGNVIVSEVTSIYDGDTFRVTIKDWPAIAGYRIGVRVKGVDTPEISGKCPEEKALARKAKQFTVGLLRSGQPVELRNLQRDKYFRLLADVYVGKRNLATELKKAGLGYDYQGGKRKRWCPVPGA